jgi:hypothetical protein
MGVAAPPENPSSILATAERVFDLVAVRVKVLSKHAPTSGTGFASELC